MSRSPYGLLQAVLAENVRVERARRQLSQEALADKANLARTYVSKVEQGDGVNVTLDVLQRLAHGLGVEAHTLLIRSRSK